MTAPPLTAPPPAHTPPPAHRWRLAGLASLATLILFLIVMLAVFRLYPAGPAMFPMLRPGDSVLSAAGGFTPDRGDIVALQRPDGSVVIRRVLAVPGDTVELRDGVLSLNGDVVGGCELGPYVPRLPELAEAGLRGRFRLEFLGDKPVVTFLANGGPPSVFPATVVKPGKLFVWGDHRRQQGGFPGGIVGAGRVVARPWLSHAPSLPPDAHPRHFEGVMECIRRPRPAPGPASSASSARPR